MRLEGAFWGTGSHWGHAISPTELESVLYFLPKLLCLGYSKCKVQWIYSATLCLWLLRDSAGNEDLKASGTQWHHCSLLLFSCPIPLSVLFYIQTCIKTLQKAITSLSYSSWNSKIIWFALLTYCITCDKCCEDHKEGVEIGAHVGSQTRKTGFAYSREEKTKGDLIAILPFPKGGKKIFDSSQKGTMKRRGDSHKLQGNFNQI